MRCSRFELGFTRNRKVIRFTDSAFRLWVTAIDFAREQKTDGFLNEADFANLPGFALQRKREVLINELVSLKALDVTEGGWLIHDFLDHQDSAEVVTEKQKRSRERMRSVRANATRTPGERSRAVLDGPSDPLSGSSGSGSSDFSDLPDQPENFSNPSGATGDGQKRRGKRTLCPLPEPFQVSQKHREYAASKSWPEWWLVDRHEHFCQLATAKNWRYADWDLALYTFLRNEIGYRRGPQDLAPGRPQGGARVPAPRQPNSGSYVLSDFAEEV